MKTDEANRICAEFMGFKFINKPRECDGCDNIWQDVEFPNVKGCSQMVFSESLDALVDVWERMQVDFDFMLKGSFVKNNFRIHNSWGACQDTETIQEAACIATAKAILGLKEK